MNFGILIFPDVEELDFVGPWELLTLWSKESDGPENCLIVAQSREAVTCAKGLSVNPHVDFENCPPLDYLLVPGGVGTRRAVNNQALVDFVSDQARRCQSVLSVCTGSFVLHAAGLLRGKKATTHWSALDRMRVLGDVEVVEQRFVQDGRVWTAAGISAGTDLMLAFIAHAAGEETAEKVQFESEYYPLARRYGRPEAHSQAPAYIKLGRNCAASPSADH